MHLAANANKEDMVKLLLEKGANYHVLDNNNNTPSQLAEIKNQKLARLIPKYRQHLKIAKLKISVEHQQEEIVALKQQLKQSLPQTQQDGSLIETQKTELSLISLIPASSPIYQSSSSELNQNIEENMCLSLSNRPG